MKSPSSIFSLFERPANVGSFDREDLRVGIGMVGSPERGEIIRLAVQFSPEGLIAGARFKAFGGPSTIAVASLACDLLPGKTAAEASRISGSELGGILRFEPSQMCAASLAVEAILASLEDVRARASELLTTSNTK